MGALPFASQTVGLCGVTLTLHSYALASEQPFRAAPTIPNAGKSTFWENADKLHKNCYIHYVQ